MFSRPGLASIDVVAAKAWNNDLEGVGEVTPISSMVSGMSFESGNIFEPRIQERIGGGSVQFGQMSPVEIEMARARVTLARERSDEGKLKRMD